VFLAKIVPDLAILVVQLAYSTTRFMHVKPQTRGSVTVKYTFYNVAEAKLAFLLST